VGTAVPAGAPTRAGAGSPPAGLSLPRSGRIVGAVTGNPTLTTERRTFLGQRALVVASTLAMMMSLALLLAAGPGAIGPLLAPIIMVMLLGAVSG